MPSRMWKNPSRTKRAAPPGASADRAGRGRDRPELERPHAAAGRQEAQHGDRPETEARESRSIENCDRSDSNRILEAARRADRSSRRRPSRRAARGPVTCASAVVVRPERPVGRQRDAQIERLGARQRRVVLVQVDVLADPERRGIGEQRARAARDREPLPGASGRSCRACASSGTRTSRWSRLALGLEKRLDRDVVGNVVRARRTDRASRQCQASAEADAASVPRSSPVDDMRRRRLSVPR